MEKRGSYVVHAFVRLDGRTGEEGGPLCVERVKETDLVGEGCGSARGDGNGGWDGKEAWTGEVRGGVGNVDP